MEGPVKTPKTYVGEDGKKGGRKIAKVRQKASREKHEKKVPIQPQVTKN